MANLAELALKEATLKTLADAISGQIKTVRAEMQSALESSGASQVRATLPDGTRVGTTSLTESKRSAQVVASDAFIEWVRENAPSELTTVTTVRPSYQAEALEWMTASGVAELPDQATGEIVSVPGVEIRAGRSASHSTRLAKDGAERIVAAWRAGDLEHLDLPQLVMGGGRGE